MFPGATLDEALHGGEDYELLFTANRRARVPAEFQGLPFTRIGTIVAAGQSPVLWKGEALQALGWDHFRK